MQTPGVCRPTTEASEIGRVRFLDTFLSHGWLQSATLFVLGALIFVLCSLADRPGNVSSSNQKSKIKNQKSKHPVYSFRNSCLNLNR
jgi:hypothetical protein